MSGRGNVGANVLCAVFMAAALPSDAATVTFRTTGTVTGAGTLAGASWTGQHPVTGEALEREITIDDTAPPVSFQHLQTDRVDQITASFRIQESWRFMTSGYAFSEASTMSITVDNMTGDVRVGYDGRASAGWHPLQVMRTHRSDATVTELIYLLDLLPPVPGGSAVNLGEADHWIGGCEKSVYRAWCYLSFAFASQGIATPGYTVAVPVSLTDQRPLVAPVPVPSSLTLMVPGLVFLAGLGRRARRRI